MSGKHIFSLCTGAVILLVLYLLLRTRTKRQQILVLGILSFAGIIGIIFDLAAHEDILLYLPLHLCSFTAFLLPAATLTRNKTICNILLLWAFGSIMALLTNEAETAWNPGSPDFWAFFLSHVLEFGIPLLLFALGLAERDRRCIPLTLIITLAVCIAVHFINLRINQHLELTGASFRVNYMFTEWPDNAFMMLFWNILPYPFWYELLFFPLAFGWLLLATIGSGKKRKEKAESN